MQNTWIFQLAADLTPEQEHRVNQDLHQFLANWKSHGHAVSGTGGVKYHRFMILQAEEGSTSGCSIDGMTREMEQILSAQNLSLLDSAHILYRKPDGSLGQIHFKEVKTAISSGELGPDTVIFDISMGQTSDLGKFELPLGKSWMGKFLPVSLSGHHRL
jgi:hypothetical protein